jgi:hypothetical protein
MELDFGLMVFFRLKGNAVFINSMTRICGELPMQPEDEALLFCAH